MNIREHLKRNKLCRWCRHELKKIYKSRCCSLKCYKNNLEALKRYNKKYNQRLEVKKYRKKYMKQWRIKRGLKRNEQCQWCRKKLEEVYKHNCCSLKCYKKRVEAQKRYYTKKKDEKR